MICFEIWLRERQIRQFCKSSELPIAGKLVHKLYKTETYMRILRRRQYLMQFTWKVRLRLLNLRQVRVWEVGIIPVGVIDATGRGPDIIATTRRGVVIA